MCNIHAICIGFDEVSSAYLGMGGMLIGISLTVFDLDDSNFHWNVTLEQHLKCKSTRSQLVDVANWAFRDLCVYAQINAKY